MSTGKTYSFLNVQATIVGPGGAIDLGNGAGAAEEGLTIEAAGDKSTMTIGADGSGMHSLHADKSGKITVRLLKTSPKNAALQAMYDLQTVDATLHGQNTLTVVNTAANDSIGCRGVAFNKAPSITYAKEGAMMEWSFDAIAIDRLLGEY